MLAILTSSNAKLDVAGAQARLVKARAEGLPVWVEPDGGKLLYDTFATSPDGHGSLPCALLVDAHGRVRGRSFASPPADPEAFDRLLAKYKPGADGRIGKDAAGLLAQLPPSIWSTAEGDAFAKVLAEGALDHLPV